MAENKFISLTTVIQAGGRSSRMGTDKGLVLLAGRPLVEHGIDQLQGLGDEIVITTNHPEDYAYLGTRTASDAVPGAGSLPGLVTALSAARGELVLVTACDMPFINRDLLEFMISLAPGQDIVVPHWNDRFQPLHAVYRRESCLQAAKTSLALGEKKLISFFHNLEVRIISEIEVESHSPDGLSFFNINTPADLAYAESCIQSGID